MRLSLNLTGDFKIMSNGFVTNMHILQSLLLENGLFARKVIKVRCDFMPDTTIHTYTSNILTKYFIYIMYVLYSWLSIFSIKIYIILRTKISHFLLGPFCPRIRGFLAPFLANNGFCYEKMSRNHSKDGKILVFEDEMAFLRDLGQVKIVDFGQLERRHEKRPASPGIAAFVEGEFFRGKNPILGQGQLNNLTCAHFRPQKWVLSPDTTRSSQSLTNAGFSYQKRPLSPDITRSSPF